ncbi:MAG TPA: hypothetical protein VEK73_10965, partial [Xanthobacteraceae bacterium]|nr:hypothetical protein [Xanthobacteraceae bacterium]
PDVKECAVIGAADEGRGQIVAAHVVLKEGVIGGVDEVKRLQDHVKATIAPYKYPRAIEYVASLPRTQTGKPVPGYQARVIDAAGNEVPPGTPGRLAVRGPTGCRYLADPRQRSYVENGWNITGDTYVMDADGWFWYQARSDDMIISAGYNIAGPEVEAALLEHPAVVECGVVGAADAERGQIVKAYVVLRPGQAGDTALTRALQDHVKATIAPYKYPRAIEYVATLPRTETGKLQRFALRQRAEAGAGQKLAS